MKYKKEVKRIRKTIKSVKQTALRGWNHSACLIFFKVPNKKHFKNQTIKLVRALPQHPKVLSDFTWFVSMLCSYMVADNRSFMFRHTLM